VSEASTLLSAAHFEYIAAHTIREDEFLRALKAAALAEGIRPIWIAAEQAAFMRILLGLMRTREVIEVGTLAGYSAIVMARALPGDGRVRTIELEPKHADFAERWIAKSDVAGRVEVHRGAALDVLPRFESNSADAAFLDADKGNYPSYLRECLRIVRPGGLIMADNALAFGQLLDPNATDREVPAVRAFNDLVAATPELEAAIVPLGDGVWVGRKRG
jgi:predicted O-methyltransferase YrrM